MLGYILLYVLALINIFQIAAKIHLQPRNGHGAVQLDLLVILLIEISPTQVAPPFKALFQPRDPAGLRCLAVLAGIRSGKILVDDPQNPKWLVVYENTFGTIYPGGEIGTALLFEIITRLRSEKMVLLGLWSDDPRWELIPSEYDYEGRVLDFYDRARDGRLKKFINQMPEGCELRPVSADLIERSINRDAHFSGYPNHEAASSDLTGFFLMKADEILCEALAGPMVLGTREMGVDTPESYRQRGYATITCAKLIDTCEQQGLQTYWNCNKTNTASMKLARNLGYQTQKEYKLVAWYQK